MSDDSSDLVGVSGDTRISVNVQQITSRFKAIQVTSKVRVMQKFQKGSLSHVLVFDGILYHLSDFVRQFSVFKCTCRIDLIL